MDRRVAVGGIEEAPITGRQFCQEGEPHVPYPPQPGHGVQLAGVQVAVALGVIGLAAQDGRDQARQPTGVHLPVAVHFHNNVGAEAVGLAVAGERRPANALVAGVRKRRMRGSRRAAASTVAPVASGLPSSTTTIQVTKSGRPSSTAAIWAAAAEGRHYHGHALFRKVSNSFHGRPDQNSTLCLNSQPRCAGNLGRQPRQSPQDAQHQSSSNLRRKPFAER